MSEISKLEYTNRLQGAVDINLLAKAIGLSKKQKMSFKHAFLYMNLLVDEFSEPEDLEQIFTALVRIDEEEIPSVPIMSYGQQELPLNMLREKAADLLIKGIIKGLDDSEVEILIQTLNILLSKEVLPFAIQTVMKLRKGDHKEIAFPVSYDLVERHLKLNQKRLES